mgnify:CR=1 FL=1
MKDKSVLDPYITYRDWVVLKGSIDQLKVNQDALVRDRELFRRTHNEFVNYTQDRLRWLLKSWWFRLWNKRPVVTIY